MNTSKICADFLAFHSNGQYIEINEQHATFISSETLPVC